MELQEVGPAALPQAWDAFSTSHIIREKDIVELFDTTPDLAGGVLDVSRYIRDVDDHHLWLFWRELPENGPDAAQPPPQQDELCAVSVGEVRKVLEKARKTKSRSFPLYRWEPLDRVWERAEPESLRPGDVLMARCELGGYSPQRGATLPPAKETVTSLLKASKQEVESDESDGRSQHTRPLTLAQHTDRVVAQLKDILSELPHIPEVLWDGLLEAARWHDVGKAHPVFQEALAPSADGLESQAPVIWAKSAGGMKRYARKGFRHELASGLALLLNEGSDLAAYLAASHHGRVRLSIRSLPHEPHPGVEGQRFARGVYDGDVLPPASLGGGVDLPETTLHLSYMELGESHLGASWLERSLTLLEDWGPFRLAALEAILRAADCRGSMEEVMSDE